MIYLKSTREIKRLRECADLVSRTLAKVARCIAPGVTTRTLDSVAEKYIISHGAIPAFKGYKVGKQVFPASLCISVNDAVVHGIPDSYRLRSGDMVSVDCGVHLNGYYGDSAYTFAVGSLSADNMQLCTTTFEALEIGISAASAGNRVGDVSESVQAWCESRGYGVVRELVGHGIGRSLHEKPNVPNFGKRGTGPRLRQGMTLCIEPMINRGTKEVTADADGWTIRTADRAPSAHYEHMIAIAGDTPEVLTTFAHIEEIVTPPYRHSSAVHG